MYITYYMYGNNAYDVSCICFCYRGMYLVPSLYSGELIILIFKKKLSSNTILIWAQKKFRRAWSSMIKYLMMLTKYKCSRSSILKLPKCKRGRACRVAWNHCNNLIKKSRTIFRSFEFRFVLMSFKVQCTVYGTFLAHSLAIRLVSSSINMGKPYKTTTTTYLYVMTVIRYFFWPTSEGLFNGTYAHLI